MVEIPLFLMKSFTLFRRWNSFLPKSLLDAATKDSAQATFGNTKPRAATQIPTFSTGNIKTSYKKLNHLSRLIAGNCLL
jgi:hypothetical protein